MGLWDIIQTVVEACLLRLRAVLYTLFVVFFCIGVYALFTGGAGFGVFLIILNTLLFVLLRKADRHVSQRDDKEFEEMIRRNRGADR